MPSSITLTVSHLPSSTSFFLSALQPLNYAYQARSGGSIGFGPISTPNTPADFWITQEIPGVPAGAAHVAFPASSHKAVQDFFIAALKAGGKIHGEPCIRDQTGYYSAAVIDFDGNSIEAVYRPSFSDENKENDVRSVISRKSTSQAPSVATRSTVSRAPTEARRSTTSQARSQVQSVAPSQVPTAASARTEKEKPSGDVLDSILNEARSAASIARDLVNQVRPNLISTNSAPPANSTQPNQNPSGDAIVGTLLGVAAGAALHYAFSNRNNSTDKETSPLRRPSVTGRSVTDPPLRANTYSEHYPPQYYQAIEAAPSSYSRASGRGRGVRYITMQDNDEPDYASTVRLQPRHRSSFDSSFGVSTHSTASRSSHRSPKLIEAAPPPTSYRAPTVLTTAETTMSRKSSRSRSRRSSSLSRVTLSLRSESRSHTSSRRRDSFFDDPAASSEEDHRSSSGAQTVLHIEEHLRVSPQSVPESSASKSKSHASRTPSRPPSKAPSHAPSKAPSHQTTSTKAPSRAPSKAPSSSSHAPSSASTIKRDPTSYPLPPSRAATWAGSDASRATFTSAKSHKSMARTVMGKLTLGGSGGCGGDKRDSDRESEITRSVVGKVREMQKLDLPEREVGPEDSVSQVSSTRGSTRSRR